MSERKHLTLDQRIFIQQSITEKKSFREIAACLGKDPSTISKEIRNRVIVKRTGCNRGNYNACIHRFTCEKSHICFPTCHASRKHALCRRCPMCNSFCSDFQKDTCKKLLIPPYVCNPCPDRFRCSLEKHFYDAASADREYKTVLSESRSGISFSEEEIRHLDEFITPLIQSKQSPHHICINNKDSIMVSERTIYRLVDNRIISAMNLDLQRKVSFSSRKKTVHVKVDKKCRHGRTYEDFNSFIKEHPDIPIVELDSVEGKKGGKVLLTIHFKKAEMMLAFLRDYNDSKSVIEIFNKIYAILGTAQFKKIFPVCLADNGSEFSNPKAIEQDSAGTERTSVFYCDPSAPYQKGSAERNHEFIRFFIPKGKSMDPYSQEDISAMMDNINSYARASLGDKCPYEMFSFLYGEEILRLLGCKRIEPNKIKLDQSIFEGRN